MGGDTKTSTHASQPGAYFKLLRQAKDATGAAAASTGGEGWVGNPFQGQFIAQPNQNELTGLGQRAQLGQQLQGFADPALNLYQSQLRGDFLSPDSNPFLRATVDAATRPVTEAFYEKALPALQSNALQSGAFKGSSRRDLAEQGLARDFERNIGDISSQIFAQNYFNERAIQQQGAQRLDEAARLAQLPSELLLQAGQGQRAASQLGLDEALRHYEEGINAPFRPLFPLASLIQGVNLGGQTTSYPGTGGLGGGIIGALGGAGIGSGIAQGAGWTGAGQGAAIGGGAGLGALLGALG